MAEEVERVTDLAAPDPVPETTENKRAKDPKKVAAGRAGAAARKAKMLEALRAAKESLRSSAAHAPPPPHSRGQYSPTGSRVEGPGTCRQTYSMFLLLEGRTNWTWFIGACLSGALIVSKLQKTKRPVSVPAIKLPADKPPDAKQLKVSLIPLL